MKSKLILLSSALLVALSAQANERTTDIRADSATAKALAAQRSGELASTQKQQLTGKARTATYKRYLDSFTQPIPKSFIDDSFGNK